MDKKTVYRSPMDENLFEEEFTIETLSDLGNPPRAPFSFSGFRDVPSYPGRDSLDKSMQDASWT